MNAYGFPPRTWAYLVSLELSELIGHHLLRSIAPERKAEAERFAHDEWCLVSRLDGFSRSTSTRPVKRHKESVAQLRAQARTLRMEDRAAKFVFEKLDEIEAALDEVAAETKR